MVKVIIRVTPKIGVGAKHWADNLCMGQKIFAPMLRPQRRATPPRVVRAKEVQEGRSIGAITFVFIQTLLPNASPLQR